MVAKGAIVWKSPDKTIIVQQNRINEETKIEISVIIIDNLIYS